MLTAEERQRVCVSPPTPDICRGEFKSIRTEDYLCLDNIKNTYSFEIHVRLMNEISLFVGCLFCRGILHLSCQSPQEMLA